VLWYLQYLLLQKCLCISICLRSSGWTISVDPWYNGTNPLVHFRLELGSSGLSCSPVTWCGNTSTMLSSLPILVLLASGFLGISSDNCWFLFLLGSSFPSSNVQVGGIGMCGVALSDSYSCSFLTHCPCSGWIMAPLVMCCCKCASLFNAFQL